MSDNEIVEKFDELSKEKQSAFLRAAERWYPPETPERIKGQTRAEHVERCAEAEKARQRVIKRDAIAAYARSLQPAPMQKFINLAAEGSSERLAAMKAKDAAQEQQKRARLAAERAAWERENHGGGSNRNPIRG